MPNTITLLLMLMLFLFPAHSHSQETHQMENGESLRVHSSALIPGSPEDRDYSEFMHQLNGVFVLLLGVLAVLERRLANIGLLRLGWPLFFFLSGIYLTVQSDHDILTICDQGFIERLQDPEVF